MCFLCWLLLLHSAFLCRLETQSSGLHTHSQPLSTCSLGLTECVGFWGGGLALSLAHLVLVHGKGILDSLFPRVPRMSPMLALKSQNPEKLFGPMLLWLPLGNAMSNIL